jgi:Uma2 family endonuclease
MSILAPDYSSVLGHARNYKDESKVILSTKISEELYWAEYYENSDENYEWNDGYLEEKPVSDFATILIYNWLIQLLSFYFHTHHNGAMVNLEMGFRLDLPKKIAIRKPDLGIVYKTNPVQLSFDDRTYHGTFDLCIEALSDTNKKVMLRDTFVKKQEYAQAGVKEYFILYDKKTDTSNGMEFYHLEQGVYQPIERVEGDIIQSKVLPGFQFRIKDLYQRPEIETLIIDPVYQQFVLPSYQSAKKQAKEEKYRADKEALRANTAEQRANTAEQRAKKAEQLIIELKAMLSKKG